MIINSNYIYILFTSFTMVLINILFACKYCKCRQKLNNILYIIVISIKSDKIHIYIDVLYMSLINRFIHFSIYSIYNIYRLAYIQKPHKNFIRKKQFRKQTKVQ